MQKLARILGQTESDHQMENLISQIIKMTVLKEDKPTNEKAHTEVLKALNSFNNRLHEREVSNRNVADFLNVSIHQERRASDPPSPEMPVYLPKFKKAEHR
jgi:hypothetical protein